jgi:3'-5' exonuclease
MFLLNDKTGGCRTISRSCLQRQPSFYFNLIPMNHRQILFLDIETVLEFETFDKLPEPGRAAFLKRFNHKIEEVIGHKMYDGPDADEIEQYNGAIEQVYQEEGPFMAEISRVASISMGKFYQRDNSKETNPDYFKCSTLVGTHDPASERTMLEKFCKVIEKPVGTGHALPFDFLCAHNGKLFDFPFLVKRLIILRMPIPRLLYNFYKKPWEVPLIDTAEMWQTTNKRSMMSLDMICYALGIPSSKSAMDGSMVGKFWREGKFAEIQKYCGADTVNLGSCFRVITGGVPIEPEFIELV